MGVSASGRELIRGQRSANDARTHLGLQLDYAMLELGDLDSGPLALDVAIEMLSAVR